MRTPRLLGAVLLVGVACSPSPTVQPPEGTSGEQSQGEESHGEQSHGEQGHENENADGEGPSTAQPAAMVAELEPHEPRPLPAVADALAACPTTPMPAELVDWYEGCEVRRSVLRDEGRWLVFDADYGEGGPESIALYALSPEGETRLEGGGLEPGLVDRMRARIASLSGHAIEDLITGRSTTQFSLNTYTPLVRARGPFADDYLWLETTDDLDRPEWILWRIDADTMERRELGRREAPLGACDGGGFWCESTNDECDEAGLRAEGRLCVLPASIERVAYADGSLLVLGTVQVAGHGGYPPMRWALSTSL